MKESDFAHFLEDETKLKISFEIKQTRLTKQQFTQILNLKKILKQQNKHNNMKRNYLK